MSAWGPARGASPVRENLRRMGRHVERFADSVAKKHGFAHVEDFWWSRRVREKVARQELMTLVTESLALTLRDAGALFGVDHSYVRQSCRAYYRRTLGAAA